MLLQLFLIGAYTYQGSVGEEGETAAQTVAVCADAQEKTLGIVASVSSGQRVIGYGTIGRERYSPCISEEEYEILLRIVEAEAGGEDEDGKLLVANVVLNRVEHESFPDSIREVVFQKNGSVTQFSPVADGRYYTVEVSQETIDAVDRALTGEDISQGALYFAARPAADKKSMRWFDENLTFLFTHGNHEFFF